MQINAYRTGTPSMFTDPMQPDGEITVETEPVRNCREAAEARTAGRERASDADWDFYLAEVARRSATRTH